VKESGSSIPSGGGGDGGDGSDEGGGAIAGGGAITGGGGGFEKGSWWHYVRTGAEMRPLEWGLGYALPLVFYFCLLPMLSRADETREGGAFDDDGSAAVAKVASRFFARNALVQASMFAVVVNTPVLLSGAVMTYVDIGWPLGLVLIAIQAWSLSGGAGEGLVAASGLRRCLACGCMLLHGGRMFLGAVVMFGQKSKWTFRFKVTKKKQPGRELCCCRRRCLTPSGQIII